MKLASPETVIAAAVSQEILKMCLVVMGLTQGRYKWKSVFRKQACPLILKTLFIELSVLMQFLTRFLLVIDAKTLTPLSNYN